MSSTAAARASVSASPSTSSDLPDQPAAVTAAVPGDAGGERELPPRPSRREVWGLSVLFGVLYFSQGVAEPTEGLIAQPVRSSLDDWNYGPGQIGTLMFVIGLPWMLKPLWGLLTDFVPLWGSRRRTYLVLASAMTTAGLGFLAAFPPEAGTICALLPLLLAACLGVAVSDVVADALMVEKGQPRGMTGTLQSVQWTASYAAAILTGWFGGYISQRGQQQLGFLVCAAFMALTTAMAIVFVREQRHAAPAATARAALHALRRSATSPATLAVLAFLFLWNFNPFANAVLQFHMARHVPLGERLFSPAAVASGSLGYEDAVGWLLSAGYGIDAEQFYGISYSVLAVGAVIGSALYGFYCRRVPFDWLVHLSIAAGMVATIAYWAMTGPVSALVVAFVVGFTYTSGMLVQLDLMARVSPPAAAGTTFALLMAMTNFSLSLAVMLGGYLYAWWEPHMGGVTAFNWIVGIGAAATASSWLVVPALNRHARPAK
jgi:MFS family permease